MEEFCPTTVLILGGFLTMLAILSLVNIYPILIRADENGRVSFILALIGIALMAVSRL